MTGKLGQIKTTLQDARGGKVVFLSHCILNQNACVRGLASQPAAIREMVELALAHDVGMVQMRCPEVSHLGSMRWGMVKKMYASPMFRRHCRQIAIEVCDLIQTWRDNDHQVLGIVLRDGSPTCGLNCAAVEADPGQVWGGMVWHASPLQRFGPTPGVYVEELQAELKLRGLDDVRLFALPEVEEAGSLQQALSDIGSAFAAASAQPGPG